MKVKDIIEEYGNYLDKEITDKLQDDIESIGIEDYIKYYEDLYVYHLSQDNPIDYNPAGKPLKEINQHYKMYFSSLFDGDRCIFNLNEQIDNDFFIGVNDSDFIKSLIDEKNDHFPIDNGSRLDASIKSVCGKFDYGDSIKPIDMYAELWWKLTKSHSFSNGNKRTAFIGTKSKMFSDILLHRIEINVHKYMSVSRDSFLKNAENIFKIISKKQFGWKSPTIDDLIDYFNNIYFNDHVEDNVWESLYSNEKIIWILDSIVKEVAKSASKGISSDYILSKFIAKHSTEEYNKNGGELKAKVLEIINAEIILSIVANNIYIKNRIKIFDEELSQVFINIGNEHQNGKKLITTFQQYWIKNKTSR